MFIYLFPLSLLTGFGVPDLTEQTWKAQDHMWYLNLVPFLNLIAIVTYQEYYQKLDKF